MVQTCCEPKPNGDKPTVEDVKELMKTVEMRIPVDSIVGEDDGKLPQ